jgi:two-component system, cell cycle response regulator DivK
MTRAPLVLIADDAEDVLTANGAILEEAGYRVATARNGEEAIAQALALRPDVILMDLAMPVLDGWEATKRIRADLRTCHIPIIAFTCYGLRRYLDRSFEAGCTAFIEKSCREPRAIVDEVRRAISEHTPLGAVVGRVHDVGSGGSSRH